MPKFYTAKNDLVFKTIMLTKQNILKKIIEINMEKLKKEWYTLSEQEKERYKYLQMLDLNKESLEEIIM